MSTDEKRARRDYLALKLKFTMASATLACVSLTPVMTAFGMNAGVSDLFLILFGAMAASLWVTYKKPEVSVLRRALAYCYAGVPAILFVVMVIALLIQKESPLS